MRTFSSSWLSSRTLDNSQPLKTTPMQIILGTMTFSDQVDHTIAATMITEFRDAGHRKLDTAFVYNKGKTEELLGTLNAEGILADCSIAGKANPGGGKGLTAESVTTQLNTSLQKLGTENLDLFYLHMPDLNTPIIDTLRAVQKHYEAGKFKEFGLSNYAAWQVAEIVELCRHHGFVEPTVYQGMYNALTRDVERELLPCLANYGIQFYVYNPLAGGMLTGKHASVEATPEKGRFATFEGYQDRYWKPDYFNVIAQYVKACESADINPAAAALRWLIHHSDIASGPLEHGIILGASSMDHFRQNLEACDAGPLPNVVLDALDNGWEAVRPACIKYFRP